MYIYICIEYIYIYFFFFIKCLMYIYIYICIYIYINDKYSTNEDTLFICSKDAHRFTDQLASPEISVRVDFEGYTLDILFAK